MACKCEKKFLLHFYNALLFWIAWKTTWLKPHMSVKTSRYMGVFVKLVPLGIFSICATWRVIETQSVMFFRHQESERLWRRCYREHRSDDALLWSTASGTESAYEYGWVPACSNLYFQCVWEFEEWTWRLGWFFKGLGVFNCSSAVTVLRSYTDLIGSDSNISDK